jgi:hypothetical protein
LKKQHERFGEEQIPVLTFLTFVIKQIKGDSTEEFQYDYRKLLLVLLKAHRTEEVLSVTRGDALRVFSERI